MANGVNNGQIKLVRTIIAVTTVVVTLLSIGLAIGAYRAQVNNNSQAILIIAPKVDKAREDIIKMQAAVERTDERTGDIKKAVERIEKKM